MKSWETLLLLRDLLSIYLGHRLFVGPLNFVASNGLCPVGQLAKGEEGDKGQVGTDIGLYFLVKVDHKRSHFGD